MRVKRMIEELVKLNADSELAVIVAHDVDDDGNLDPTTGHQFGPEDIEQLDPDTAAIVADAAFGEMLQDEQAANSIDDRRNRFWMAFHALPSVRLWRQICALPLPCVCVEGIRAYFDGKENDLPTLLGRIEDEMISAIGNEAKCGRLRAEDETIDA